MNLKLPIMLGFVLCLFVFSTNAQSKVSKQSLPLVNYNTNVNSPLSSVERQQLEEVYGNKLQEYVLSKPERLKAIKNILRNRVSIVEIANPKNQKETKLLSEVSLFDYYVSNLKRDISFNKNTFNPLKYNFDFYKKGASMYQVDNTNYFIVIKSQHQK